MAARLMLISPGSMTWGFCVSSFLGATTFSRVLTPTTRATTHLESASCVMGNPTKAPLMRMRVNTPRPMPRLVTPRVQVVRPCHHLWGNHSPS
jgi:hypothetical protein